MSINYSSKILNNAVRSLSAQQAVIASIGNNIANVNTPGYVRRVAQLETATQGGNVGIQVGNGVTLAGVTRQVDDYLAQIMRGASSDKNNYGIVNDFMARVDGLFDLSGNKETIGSNITAFFQAVNNLSVDPSSIELRRDFIERASDLTSSIRNTFNSLADLQHEADDRIRTEVEAVNSITTQLASLNTDIARVEAAGGTAADQRDQRDVLLQSLSEKVSFTTIDNSDGTKSVFLSNGFALVNGTHARELETTTSPSFVSGPMPPSLWGGILSHIVYDYAGDSGNSHLDLTQVFKAGSGTVGGLLSLRGYNDPTNTSPFQADGTITEIASRIESMTRTLLTSVNFTYLGPDRDSGTVGHQASSGDLDGNNPSVFGLFDFTYSGLKDADGDGIPETSDLTASGIASFSSILGLSITDPRDVAAARDASSGPPALAVYAPGDGRNMLALAGLQTSNYTFTQGAFSLNTTFDGLYNDTITFAGNAKSRATLNASVAADSFTVAANQYDEVTAVNLDEEFTSLIKFQKAFEASAKMIQKAGDLLETVVNLI